MRQVLLKFPQLVELVAIFSIWGKFYIYSGTEIGRFAEGAENLQSTAACGSLSSSSSLKFGRNSASSRVGKQFARHLE